MKKLFALITVLAMLMGLCAYADSETLQIPTDAGFTILLTVPDGYTMKNEAVKDIPITVISFLPEKATDVMMTLTVAFDEEFAGRSYMDLSQEEIDSIFMATAIDMLNPTISFAVTAGGTQVVIIDENSEYDEYAMISTLYQGYWVDVKLERVNSTQ